MANIKRLLSKKGWTGRELGQIELTSLAVDYRNALEGNEDAPNIIDPAELQRMVNSITDREQGRTYNGYLSIHDWLSIKVNIANAQYQSAQLHLNKLSNYITQAMQAEEVYQYIEQLPAILTQKEYDELRAERIEAYFKDKESGDELYSNIFNLVERCITYYVRQLKKDPKKSNPLKAIRKKYLTEPVKSELILSRWNEAQGEGYYTIEDGSGRRSDQMSLEEWQAAITTPLMGETLRDMRATDGSGTELTERIAEHRLINRARVIFNGGTEEEADKAQKKEDYEAGLATPVKWHTYTEPPTDLTKWDIIEQELLLEFYPASLDGEDPYTESNFLASMEDFYREFKELVDFALQDMDKKYFNGDEVQAAKLSLKEWEDTTISWRRLYELDFYGEKAEAEDDNQLFDGNKRALYNGIAIIRPSTILDKSRRIDERGYYVEPDISSPFSFSSLEAFFTESEYYAANTHSVEDSRAELRRNYYYLLGYNMQVDLVAAYYDVPELEVFKLDLPSLAERIEAINALIPLLYKQIKDTDYRDTELQARKMGVLKDIFPPLDIDFTIPEENIAAAKELFKDFKAFTTRRELFDDLMCHQPQTEDADGEGA